MPDSGLLSAGSDECLGRVIAVSPSGVMALVEGHSPGTNGASPLAIGSLVKIPMSGSTVYLMVAGLRAPLPDLISSDREMKLAELELLGEIPHETNGSRGRFQRGVSWFPSLDDTVCRTSLDDFASVYAPPDEATAAIGTVHQHGDVPAYLLIDDLLGKHFSIVGTTGSGKSCAVATILHAVIDCNPNAHVIIVDPHNEYATAFGEHCVLLSPDDGLHLPYWLFNFEEISTIVLGVEHDIDQTKILGEAIMFAKQAYFTKIGLEKNGTIDTPAPYRMSEVLRYLDTAMGSLSRPESVASYQAVKSRILSMQTDSRYAFVFGSSLALRDDMAIILSQLFRIPVDGKPITIIDISAVPSEVLNIVIAVVCRLTFDFAMWSARAIPITIVCEEAHRYAPRNRQAGFEPAKRALSRIAKEGRKYGVSICVVTQRPSDLAEGLLSQCNTLFALRMTNQDDQAIIRSAVPEASHSLMNFLPALRNGEAIVVGEGVTMPMRVSFTPLLDANRPKSATASFSAAWSDEFGDLAEVEQTIDRWRRGVRHNTV
jgi:DNA helicase HerA-like ATPase